MHALAHRLHLSNEVRRYFSRDLLAIRFCRIPHPPNDLLRHAHARDVVHGRDTGYAMQLWLRLAGYRASMYTVLGWEPRKGEKE